MQILLNLIIAVLFVVFVVYTINSIAGLRMQKKLLRSNEHAVRIADEAQKQLEMQHEEAIARFNATQERTFALMEEHNSLLRSILEKLDSR